MSLLSDDFYGKYFPAYDTFRAAVARADDQVVSFEMFAAARVLSDTPMSAAFFDKVKAVAAETSDRTPTERRQELEAHAREALTNCGLYHQGRGVHHHDTV